MSKEIFGDLWGQIEAVVAEKGVSLIVDNKEKPGYIPKSRFDEVVGSKNELKTQVGELSNQLNLLKESAKGNEALTKQIEELQAKNGEWEGKYKSTLLESAIKIKAITEKAKDAGDLLKFLDISKLEAQEDGNIKGLDEQIIKLKETKAYLFDVGAVMSQGTGSNPTGTTNSKTETQQLEESYQEAMTKGNMPLAIALKNKLINMINKKG
jgi:hypothetical protein